MIKSDLGAVTAYADAVAHGYTGTREDFGKLLAGAGQNLADAAAAKDAAEAAADNAGSAAQTATDAAGTAGQAAGAATNAAGAASTSAGAAAQSAEAAETAQQGAENAAKKAVEAKTGAENALKDADTAKDAASGYADAATESATAAEASATNAADSAKSASDAAQKIEDSAEKIEKNADAVSQLKEDKLNKPALPVVGELLRVKSVSDTGEVELETEDISELQKRQNVLVGSKTGNPASCDDAFAAPLCGLNVYGKSTQDGTPTPDAPVPIVSTGDGGTIAVKMTGKNLLYIPDGTTTARGVTATSKNGIISISGTATEDGYVYLPVKQISIHGLAFLSSNVSKATAKLVSASWKVLFTQGSANNTQEVITRICFIVKKGTNYDLNGINVQLELGSTATAYSPYREQLLTLPTSNGLPGIPVTSGGNYTDQTGQRWVCDEVDLERGVRVKNTCIVDAADLGIATSTDLQSTKRLTLLLPALARNHGTNALCNRSVRIVSFDKDTTHFYVNNNNIFLFIPISAENPVAGEYIFLYALAAPVETPLTPAEIAAYKALTTYAPDTVVQASDGAGVKLDYQRDVNLVVKNLEDAIASMTTT